MVKRKHSNSDVLDTSVQINDGFNQTSADGASLVFDSKYGIMFCLYMPGGHGCYGESRSRICLTYFPASQPTNTRTVEIASGNMEYVPQIISLGPGKVRAIYEKNSKADCDHPVCYKDFDYLTETLSEEKCILVKQTDGTEVCLTQSVQFAWLEQHGYHNHRYCATEQIIIGGCTPFMGEDGYWYGAIPSLLSEVILYRSSDNLATIEFFAVCPEVAQYEFDYKILDGKIYAIYRTDTSKDSICFVSSEDNGKTWTTPIRLKDSIDCRPRMIVYANHILMAYNIFNPDTGNRPVLQGGRTEIKLLLGENADPNENTVVADIYSKCGIVNISLCVAIGSVEGMDKIHAVIFPDVAQQLTFLAEMQSIPADVGNFQLFGDGIEHRNYLTF